MKALHYTSFVLLVIGGLNWLLVGIFNWNLVTAIFGGEGTWSRIVYSIVGLATLVILFTHKTMCKSCDKSSTPTGATM